MPPRSLLGRILLACALATPALVSAQTDAPAAAATPAFTLKTTVINPEDLLDSNRTLVVPTVYVTVLTDGRVAATRQSGLFQSGSNTAKASASYKVAGLDKAFVQQLAQAAYDDFVAQLRAAGYTVLTYADIKDREVVRRAARETGAGPLGLPVKSEGGNNFVTAAPSDEQLFKSGLAGGEFSEFISGGKTLFPDATLVLPQYTFVAPQAWAEGSRGYKSVSAEANVAEGMNLLHARSPWLGQPKSRMMRGIPGVATTEQVINVTEKAGALAQVADTTPDTANAVSRVLSVLGGGSIQRSGADFTLTIDREAYGRGVLGGVRAFNAEVAKAAAAAKP